MLIGRPLPAAATLVSVSLVSLIRLPAVAATVPVTASVPVEELRLDNGMKLLLVQRPEATTVAAGWMVQAGSADDEAGRTGLSHLLEHLLFKGTRTVGAKDLERESDLLDRQEEIWRELRALERRSSVASGKRQRRLGQRLAALRREFDTVQRQADSMAYLGQFSLFYSELGAVGLNANTLRDLTLYFVSLPSESLEAWFWLESDRLLEPVFRQFHREIGVIREERRQRIESTPTGQLDEELRELFWEGHPYAWDPQGRAGDLERVGRHEAREHFRRYYRADRVTASIVGGFDRQQVEAWARRYFGRLRRDPSSPAPSAARSTRIRDSEERFEAVCACASQATALYPSPAFDQPDTVALQVLAAVMNGRAGRLHRSLVLEQQLALSATTRQMGWKRAGEFAFHARTKGDTDPSDLLAAWDREVDRIRAEAIAEVELRRAKNRATADAFRSLKDPLNLLKQLLIYEGLGDWRYVNRWSAAALAVTPQDLQRVAVTYLVPEHRTVALYRRQPGSPDAKGPE